MNRRISFRDLSIKRKLMLIGLSTIAAALICVGVVQTILHWYDGKKQEIKELVSIAQLSGLHAAHELSFGHTEGVDTALSVLKVRPEIVYAAYHDNAGRLIASYQGVNGVPIPMTQLPRPDTYLFTASGLVVAVSMNINGHEQGVFYLQSNLKHLHEHIVEHAKALALIGLVAFVLAAIVFAKAQRTIVGPLSDLAGTIESVSVRRDYTLRARKTTYDEIGTLVDGFNAMLSDIETRDTELARHRQHLEEEVAQRTAELNAARIFLEGITTTSAGVIFALDLEGRFEFVNERGLDLVGYSLNELLQRSFITLISPEAQAVVMQEFAAVLRGEPQYAHETTIVRSDGAVRWIEYSAAPLTQDGKIVRIVGTATDITERRQAALVIEASERKLRGVLDATTEGIMLVDAQTRKAVLVNRAICDMLGYSPEEIAALGVDDIHPADSLPHVLRQFERQVRGEIKIASDMPVLRKDGSVFFADISTSPMMLSGRMCMLGAFHDITERKRAEDALKMSEERFRGLVESSSDLVWETDAKGAYTYISPRVYEMLGYSPEELVGSTPFDLMPPEERQRVAGEFAALVAGHQPIRSLENTNRHKDGRLVVLETNGMPFFLPDGGLGGYRGIGRDVTERIRARQ